MRLLLRALCTFSILFGASYAKADITIVKAGTSANSDATEESNRHRYDNEAKNLDQDSKYIESRISKHNTDSSSNQKSGNDFQVTMIKIKR